MHKKLMWREVYIYNSIKAIVATDIVKDIVTTQKKPESKENQLGILKIYAFCQKIQQRASGPGESTAWLHIYIWEYTQKVATSSP